jgi:ketosteroid isomerase-like protein
MATTETALEQRIRAIEDREQIRDLVARYCYVMDDRDLDGTRDILTDEVVIRSSDGKMNSEGRDAVLEMYKGRWNLLGPSFHWTHDVIVELDEHDADRATGVISCHAEVVRRGKARLAAIRYLDEYRRGEDGRWRFSERSLSYYYYLDPREYADVLEHPLRVRVDAEADPPGFPEATETFRRYYEEHPRT